MLFRSVLNHQKQEWYIVEVGDPVQGRGYDVGAREKHETGIIVADFAYPRWFGYAQSRPQTSAAEELAGAIHLGPFAIGKDGYMSVAPEAEPENWSQIYGQDRSPDCT